MADEMNDMIRRYREGSLTSAERHALEKKALSDPFLAEALEGAESISAEEFSADVASLSEKLQQRKKQSWLTPVRIAASILLLIGIGSIFYYVLPGQEAKQELQTANLKTNMDSTKIDSATSMLSLAKPDETEQEEKRSTNQPPPEALKKNDLEKAGETKSTGEPSGEAEKTALLAQMQQEEKLKSKEIAEEKTKISPPELADKKSEELVITESPSALGAGAKDDSRLDTREKAALKRSSTEVAEEVIKGKVISAIDGSPLPGVNVVLKGTDKGTVTDAKGNFSIATPKSSMPLVFSFIGFQPVEVTSDKAVIDVAMNEDVSQLSEVVATGRRIPKDDSQEPVVRMAMPVGGIRAYNKYLEANLRYPPQALETKVKGKVTVSFTVTIEGALTEFEVVKGLGYGCDDEVIRLVKEGPKWTPSFRDDVAVESEVKVKMKFDPEKANK
jgi:TonB family protein